MKVIARYLPQFHHIPENDIWWGRGFTDWTTVCQAEPLFQGHRQPSVPLEKNYYNLLLKDTMQWQSDLAKKYGIDGFDFYHYWFKDGRQILEKPAENLLRWHDIDMPFCFTWANQTWARTWSKFTDVNDWVTKEEIECNPHDDGVLLRQSYGQEEDWMLHIRYLLPFFKDSRYIRHEDKPVFIIYHPDHIYCWPDMRECWEGELRKEGIAGLYVLGERQREIYDESQSYDARLWRFPAMAFNRMIPHVEGGVKTYDYDEYWQKILHEDWRFRDEEKGIYCLAANFDSTPRHGKHGLLLAGDAPGKFSRYFAEFLHSAVARQDEFVFINAWNEWGEGAYLEPDEENGYGYLEAVLAARTAAENGRGADSDAENRKSSMEVNQTELRLRRNLQVLDFWMSLREQGRSVAQWLMDSHINTVAIYGLGYLGRHLLTELTASGIEVSCVIDRDVQRETNVGAVRSLSDELIPADAIIVTPAGQYDAIRRDIKKRTDCRTISLEHILTELQ